VKAEATVAEAAKPTRQRKTTQQPAQEPSTSEQPAGTAPSTPEPLEPAPTPEPTLEQATMAVAEAAIAAGMDSSWPALDQLARDAANLEPDQMTIADWLALRERIAAGEFGKAAAG
jgi:hypothetical protein